MDIFGFFSVPNWLLILMVLFISCKVYLGWHKNIFQKMGVVVPEGGTGIFGHVPLVMKEGVFNIDIEWSKKHGDVYGTFEGRNPVLITTDLDMIKQILVKDFSNFRDRRADLGLSGDLAKNAVTVLSGERWKQVRNILTPIFSSGKLKQMLPMILTASDKLVDNTKRKLKDSKVVDCKRLFGCYLLDVIATAAFGVEIDSQSNPDDPIVKNAARQLQFGAIAGMIAILFPFLGPFFGKLGFAIVDRESSIFFQNLLSKIISERKLNRQKRKDFLELLLEAEDDDNPTGKENNRKGLTTEEVISQAATVFTAGYETTGSTLALLAHNLAMNQDKQQSLYEEIIRKLGSEKPTYEALQELDCLEMYINETLRMYSIAPRLDRTAEKDIEIKGIKIPKGMLIQIPVNPIHYSPEYWEDPKEFKPERFSQENKSSMNPLHFLPFGYGPRHCIGMRLAYLQAKVAIVEFVRNFKVSFCSETKVPPNLSRIAIVVAQDVFLWVEERE